MRGVYDESVIHEAGARLHSAAPGATVILFGSHARGDADDASDLDFLVIEPEVGDAATEEVRLRRSLRGLGLFADLAVVSAADAERLRNEPSSLVGMALTEGRVLAA